MLFLQLSQMRSPASAHFYLPWKCRVSLSATGNWSNPGENSGPIDFTIDSGATYSILPMEFASQIGLDSRRIKQDAAPVRPTSVTGQRLDVYLCTVFAQLRDDNGGTADWSGEFGFYEPDPVLARPGRRFLLGHVDFLDSVFRVSQIQVPMKGEWLALDPRNNPALAFHCGPDPRGAAVARSAP